MSLGKRIWEIRNDARLSGTEFGGKIGGIKKGAISTYESNKVTPSIQVLAKICHEFNVNGHWLVTGEGEKYLDGNESNSGQDYLKLSLAKLQKEVERLANKIDGSEK